MRSLPLAARLYVAAVVGAALMVVVGAIPHISDWRAVLLFAVLYIAIDSLPVGPSAARSSGHTITVTTPAAIATAMVLGPWGAAVVAATSLLDISPLSPVKRMFNAAQLVLSAFVAGEVYLLLGGTPVFTVDSFPRVLVPTAIAGMAYLAMNSTLVGGILVLAEHQRWRVFLADTLSRVTLPGIAYAALALVIAVLWSTIGGLALIFGLVPLLVARWAMSQFAEEQDAYRATIATLIQAVETKDPYTRGHSERVARASVMIGRRIGMSDERLQTLEYAGTLHDVGKLGVPTTVLRKSGKLTDEEFDAIKLHPTRGHDMVREIRFLDEALEGIYHHHERIDGRGYPSGLQGQDIPEFARIIGVADAFDSMTSTRSYRSARSIDEALVELERCKGTQFDPDMVDAMVAAVTAQGWTPAQAPTPAELGDQVGIATYDDDDPLLAPRMLP
jgi:HD superfamily phosphohydrolase YqeK